MTRTSCRDPVGMASTVWCSTESGLAKPDGWAIAGLVTAAARAIIMARMESSGWRGPLAASTRTLRARAGPAQSRSLQNGAANPHNPLMFDWDDIRYFLAVARHGSTLAAGRALGVNQSTVTRRLAEMERRL